MFLAMDNEAIGIKTGFTGKAGYCFVGAVKSNGRHFVSCVLPVAGLLIKATSGKIQQH